MFRFLNPLMVCNICFISRCSSRVQNMRKLIALCYITWKTVTSDHNKVSKFLRSQEQDTLLFRRSAQTHGVPSSFSQNLPPNKVIPSTLEGRAHATTCNKNKEKPTVQTCNTSPDWLEHIGNREHRS